jgi:predicted regulator of Ras-like GTPase activity (Roadblock/LC7/MglB family)
MGDYNHANLLAISSLVVGDLAASQEIARLTGEYHDQQIVLREGKKARTLIAEAGDNLVIFVQVSNYVPLGWARVGVLQATQKLTEITRQPPTPTAEENAQEDLGLALGGEDLSDLFENALDDIWTE